MFEKVIKKLEELYNNIDEYGYANPVQTRPKPEPGITGEEPGEIKDHPIGGVVFNKNFSSKKVNQSSNKEFKDDEDVEDV